MAFAPWFKPALLRSMRTGYGKGDFLADLSAGMLVGVVALPLSMGLAIASGVSPEARILPEFRAHGKDSRPFPWQWLKFQVIFIHRCLTSISAG